MMQQTEDGMPFLPMKAGAPRGGAHLLGNPLLLVLAVAGCWAVWTVLPFVGNCIAHRADRPSWLGSNPDLDTFLIHGGLVAAPRFGDTLRWWTGVWVGQVPFYRPLTSYAFWLEWQAFGDQEGLYSLPAAAAHVGATLLFTLWVYRLAERQRGAWPGVAALVATAGFIGVLEPYRQDVVVRILMWKNQPDALAAMCCFASLLAYPRARDGQRGALAAAGAGYLAACGFKEVAVPLPLVFLALEAPLLLGGERRRAWERLIVMGALGMLFLTLRWAAIGGMGFTYGSNAAWRERTLINLVGPFAPMVVSREWTGNVTGIWAYLVGLGLVGVWRRSVGPTAAAGRRGLWPGMAGFLLLVLGWSWIGWPTWLRLQGMGWRIPVTPADYMTGLLVCLQPVELALAAGTAAFLGALTVAGRWCRPALGIGLVWTVAFLAPLTLSPGPAHRYYLPQAGYLLVYACAAGVGLPLLIRALWPSLDDHVAAFRR